MCQQAEELFTGVRSGLLDQVTSIFGKADHAVFFDARTEEIRTIAFPAKSGARHCANCTAARPRGRENTMRAERKRGPQPRPWGFAPSAIFHPRRSPSGPVCRNSCGAAPPTSRAKMSGSGLPWSYSRAAMGRLSVRLMNQSHESSRVNFENSSPELDQLVRIAQRLPGVLGSRLTGGGFGGATISLCERPRANEIAASLRAAYEERTGLTAPTFVCRLSDGAR